MQFRRRVMAWGLVSATALTTTLAVATTGQSSMPAEPLPHPVMLPEKQVKPATRPAVLPFCDTICRDGSTKLSAAERCVGYRYGDFGLAVDYRAMEANCSEAAAQGDANAQTLLAEMRFLGLGVAQDFDAALRWYRQAADQQQAHAQLMMYEMTRLQLAPATTVSSAEWLRRAASGGHPQALALLQH